MVHIVQVGASVFPRQGGRSHLNDDAKAAVNGIHTHLPLFFWVSSENSAEKFLFPAVLFQDFFIIAQVKVELKRFALSFHFLLVL